MPQPIVVIMAKAPRPGNVKTRLVPPLRYAEAAELATVFVCDTVLNARRVVDHVMIAYTPLDARLDLEPILPAPLLWFEQAGNDLGERLESVVNSVSNLGYSPLVVLGADSPTLPAAFLKEALEILSLGQTDISLGPTADGGYYLVGLNNAIPGLFRNIDWSTPLAYKQTRANAIALNLRVHELPMWYDVDTPSDLFRLRDQVLADRQVLSQKAPNTCRWLETHELFRTGA